MRRLNSRVVPYTVIAALAPIVWGWAQTPAQLPPPGSPQPVRKPVTRPGERPTPAPTAISRPVGIKPAPVPAAKKPVPRVASAARPKVAVPLKKTLPNGLTILVLENRAAPVVAVRVYVKTGSIYEGQYLGSGISHLFEHTLGEGTKGRSKQELDTEVQAIGGQSNAYTSYDVTAYHITTASSYFERALNNLADQMQNATFPESEVKTQQGVIHNEMNLDDDDPDRVLSEMFYATAFRVHPVRFPIIGYREAFDRLTRDDILNYYKTHYTPENTVVSVAGDVNAERALRAVGEAFKGWERRSAATPAVPDEPVQTTRRRAVVEKDVNLTYLQQGWHTVPLQHPDLYALDVLAQILGGGESSRLVRELREKHNLVSSISAYSSTPNYNAGVFAIRATLPPKNLDKVGKAIWDQVGKIRATRVSMEELQRAQRQIETSFIFNNSSVEEQAEQMAYDELSTGDPTFSRSYVDRIKLVTRTQVLEAARKYLTSNGFTTAIVRPRSKAGQVAATQSKGAVKPPQMVTLPNGMRLIIRENHATPTVSIVVQGLGGARLEPRSKAGLANLFAQMLTRGTTKLSYEQIASTVDALGATFEPFSGYNAWGVQSQWLSSDWRKGLTLIQQSLLQPAFPATELARLKAQVGARIQEQQDDPMTAASLLLRQTFYGDHPYGRSSLGTAASVASITRSDLVAYWNQVMLPRSTVLSIYGDVNPAEVRRLAGQMFSGFTRGGKLPGAPAAAVPPSQFIVKEQSKPGVAQAVLFFGYPSIKATDPDRYAIDVLDAALSGSNLPGGRLHARLRDNQLVYVVHAFDQPGLDPGMFVVYAATTKANRAKVQSIIQEELQKVREADISPQELAIAKSMAISAHAIESQTDLSQAQQAAGDELLGLGYNESTRYEAGINAVTIADVRRAAQQYLRPNAAALAVVEPVGESR